MTILTSNDIPLGLRGLSMFLIGMGALYLTAFVGLTLFVFDVNAGNYYEMEPIPPENFLWSPLLLFGLPGSFALLASWALFSQKKIARIFLILYGGTSVIGLHQIGHPVFLFAITGAITLYYVWQPQVREYFLPKK